MKRFVIRNYGPSRQIPFGSQQICFSRDTAIETDDEKLVEAMRSHKAIHVTDRGIQVNVAPEPKLEIESELRPDSIVDSPEALHNESSSETVDTNSSVTLDEVTEAPYQSLDPSELRTIAKDRRVWVRGMSKEQMVEALKKYDQDEPITNEEQGD